MIQRKVDSRDKCIRTWSAGCSRGDEAYSIAIAIMEVLPSYREWRISIFGTDINRNGLACAKEAIYGEKDIGHLPKEYLDKYFEIRGSTYLLHSDVRELVQVEYHNLVKDPYIHEGMQNIDLVFCRNVTIYFDYQTTRRVIDNFYNCLAPGGYLFLGHAETLWQISNKFERIEFPQTFIYKRGLGLVPEDEMRPFVALPEIPIEDLTSTKEAGAEKRFFLQELRSEPQRQSESPRQIEKPCAVREKAESAYQEAPFRSKEIEDQASLSSPDHGIAPDRNQMLTDLGKATILANEAKYKEAADVLARVIEEDNLSVEAYYLLGVLSCKSGDLKEAETQFRRVIYVDPDSVLAYFNLGNIYLYQRRFSRAAREFRNAARLLGKRPKDEQIRFCEDFTVEFLLRVCRKNLVEISRRGELT
jgi:chemotaxis protein methyltransferase CheR